MSDPLMPIEILERIHEFSVRGANDELTEEHWAEFEQLLRENDDACRMYGQYVDVSGLLPAILSSLSAETAPSTDVAFPEPLEPARSPALPLLGTFWHGAIGFFSQEIPFALLVGTVITSLGLLAGSMVYVTHSRQSATNTPRPMPSAGSDRKVAPSNIEYVGRVTGMVDVQWNDINTSTEQGNRVPLGRKYALASGLMEITYDTGARVILQGPVTYEVDSRDSGFLSVGKLTARLEKKRSALSGQPSAKVASESNPEIPKSPIPNPSSPAPRPQSLAPLFAVRTPTAVVTDLGTEFGVEVDKSGRTGTQVFIGAVEVAATSDQSSETVEHRTIRAGQYALVEMNRAISTGELDFEKLGTRFTRTMPKPRNAAQSYADLVLSMNPAVYYRMDQWPATEGKGRYVLVDSASGGHNGVAYIDESYGKPSNQGKFGSAMDIHNAGANEHAYVADYPKTQDGRLSVSAWVKPLSPDPYASIVGNRLVHNTSGVFLGKIIGQFSLGLNHHNELRGVVVQGQDGQFVEVCEQGKRLPSSQWHHVAMVADGAMVHLYRNGAEVAKTPYQGIVSRPAYRRLDIGCYQLEREKDGKVSPAELTCFWDGWIDEVAVFNHALNAEQVRQLCKGQATAK